MPTNSIASIATSLPPIELVSWLNAEGSLTAMLEEKAGQPLRVERTFEGYRLLTLQQKRQLGLQGSALN
ncbi:MAG TPA: chorismate--pyruvate lyase, partial [Psychrobacter sp.]|nr:chorismate--pyruvate lyase [Psychrobacter sp.]